MTSANTLDRIEYESIEGGLFELVAWSPDGKEVLHEDEIGIERVEDLVGKELAQKIQNLEGEETGGAYRDWRTLNNVDLKVGGEGMKAFYDKMLPSMVNKYVKKWGGKVEPGVLEGDLEAWVLPITTQMRDGAMAGQPLFQPLNHGVDLDQAVPIVQAEAQLGSFRPADLDGGEGLAHLVAIIERQTKTVDLGKGKTVRKVAVPAIGQEASLSNNNIRHAISSAMSSDVDTLVGVEAVANLPQLIESAVLVETHEDKKNEPGLRRIHRLFAGFGLENKTYAAKITIKEYEEGSQTLLDGVYSAYDAKLEKAVPDGNRVSRQPQRAESAHSTSGTNIILRDLLSGVKDSDGKPYLEGAERLNQADDIVRGMTEWRDGDPIVTLFKKGKVDTVIHELGHVLRREMADFAMDEYIPRAPASRQRFLQLRRDYETICRFVGADPHSRWTRAQEETFADAFLAYVYRGEAPSKGLRSAFEYLRRQLVQLYEAYRDNLPELDKEIVGVFDRVLATEAETRVIRAERSVQPTIEGGDGLTAEQVRDLQQKKGRAYESVEKLIRQHRLQGYIDKLPRMEARGRRAGATPAGDPRHE